MRWTSWLPRSRSRRLSVVGLDIGPEACSLVVLSGSPSQPDSVCCAERLELPAGLVAHGEVLQSVALGQWLQRYLEAGDYQPQQARLLIQSKVIELWLTFLRLKTILRWFVPHREGSYPLFLCGVSKD